MPQELEAEIEATFTNIDKNEIRSKLKNLGAKLVKPEHLQKRHTFHLPEGCKVEEAWLRVRDESDKITLSLKATTGEEIFDQKELCLNIDSYENGVSFLTLLGCKPKSYQETKRELWMLDDCEITIDEWPFLEPLIEIEGKSEENVKKVSSKLDFNWEQAQFCSVSPLYAKKYNIRTKRVNDQTPLIVFDMENPFL